MQTPSQNADATNNTQSPGGFFYSSLRSNGGSNSNLVRVLTPKSENSKLQIVIHVLAYFIIKQRNFHFYFLTS